MATFTLAVTTANGIVCYAIVAAKVAPAIGSAMTVHGHNGNVVGTVSAII